MTDMTANRKDGIALLLVFACLVWTTTAFADFAGKVVAVKDGDTLEVMKEGGAVRGRLYGIDCPKKGQAFGHRAKQAASDLTFGKTVEVRDKGRDRYGRMVGEVILEDSRSLNRELVRAGLAWWYRQYAKKEKANRTMPPSRTSSGSPMPTSTATTTVIEAYRQAIRINPDDAKAWHRLELALRRSYETE